MNTLRRVVRARWRGALLGGVLPAVVAAVVSGVLALNGVG